MSTGQKNIFISHVHEDDDVLKDLKSLLTNGGYEIRDGSINSSKPNEAESADYIKSEILGPRIKWASTLIVLISPKTHESEWVNWEIEYAHKEGKRIVGVWDQGAQESDLPKAFQQLGDALVGWQADRVMDAINGKITNWFAPDGSEHAPRDLGRYSCK